MGVWSDMLRERVEFAEGVSKDLSKQFNAARDVLIKLLGQVEADKRILERTIELRKGQNHAPHDRPL